MRGERVALGHDANGAVRHESDPERAEESGELLAGAAPFRSYDDDFLGSVQFEIERQQELGYGRRIRVEPLIERREQHLNPLAIAIGQGQLRQAQEIGCRYRISGRDLPIEVRFLAGQQTFVRVARVEVSAALVVRIVSVENHLQTPRPDQPIRVRIGLVKIEQSCDQEGVVLQEG